MDRRDSLTDSYFMLRGISGSDSGSQFGLHGSGMHPLNNPNLLFQSNIGGSATGSTLPAEPLSAFSPHGVNVSAPSVVPISEPVKRKRGRPRKYIRDGGVSLALSPSSTTPVTMGSTQKRGRGRPPGSGRKQQLAYLGGVLSGSAGMGFTPHVITIAVGQDIATKIMSFSQQGPRGVCVLSANGSVSAVTLCQPSSSGGTVTFEGRFEILCLSGSYLLTDNGGFRNRTGGLSVALSSSDGRVVGGGVGGMLIAASPVQVIVGSFMWGGEKTKNKKQDDTEEARPLEHPITDNARTPTVPTSQMGMWPGSRPIDIHNSHGGIDLMGG